MLIALVSVLYAERRRRSTPHVFVDGWIEVRVVVHLHLAVELEAPGAALDGVEEGFEAGGEVVALLFEEGETGGVAEAVGFSGGFAVGLDAGVEDSEGEDGEAVDDEAGSFGVKGGFGVLLWEVREEPNVDFFHNVVAALVEAVDGALNLGDVGVGGVGIAGFVFLVPEVEVFAVLGGDEGG